MNLLFDFLKHLQEKEKQKLKSLVLKGRSEEVLLLMNQQVQSMQFERETIQAALGISSAHLDKITSQLLSKCYEHLFGANNIELLLFLSERAAFVKQYYQEMKRQMSYAEANFTKKQLAEFYKANVNFIHFNMPIIHKDEEVLKMLAHKYLAIEKNKNSKLLIECKLMYVQIDKQFAASTIKAKEVEMKREIERLGKLPNDADEELAFSFYWLKIYFNNAIEDFKQSLVVTSEALTVLRKFKSTQNHIQILRVELKQAELLYYLSRFEESFQNFEKWMKAPQTGKLPDYSYYSTKYLQVCLITNHLQEAKNVLAEKETLPMPHLKQALLPRDIISFAKYYLFSRQYDEAFDFIQLGFEKNPKGKYFQYEVELRNLQTAYFFLTNQKDIAVQMCAKHIKYLRAHGYTIRDSDFPYFYVLTKAIYEKKRRSHKLSNKETDMLQRYQLGSYAVYGKLLLKMLES